MMMTLREIAQTINAELRGDPETTIDGIETTAAARPGHLTFAENARHHAELDECRASAVIVAPETATTLPAGITAALLVHDEPGKAFATIARMFRPLPISENTGTSPRAWISPSARIDPAATVYPGCFVGDDVSIGQRTVIYPGVMILDGARIGADVRIFPNAVLYENTIVNDRCVVHAGAILGAWGFGYKSDAAGHRLSEQLGYVELCEDVEIGACATIDRGTWGATRIGAGSKLDNQVMIGHNCQIGPHNLLCSQVGIAGSCQTGSFVVMAGQVGIADHASIGDAAILCAKTGVVGDLDGGQTYLGSPALPVREQRQVFAIWPRLPEMRREIKHLKKRLDELTNQRDGCESRRDETSREAA